MSSYAGNRPTKKSGSTQKIAKDAKIHRSVAPTTENPILCSLRCLLFKTGSGVVFPEQEQEFVGTGVSRVSREFLLLGSGC